MSAQAAGVFGDRQRVAAVQDRAQRRSRSRRAGDASALRSICVIWPIFSSSVICASSASTSGAGRPTRRAAGAGAAAGRLRCAQARATNEARIKRGEGAMRGGYSDTDPWTASPRCAVRWSSDAHALGRRCCGLWSASARGATRPSRPNRRVAPLAPRRSVVADAWDGRVGRDGSTRPPGGAGPIERAAKKKPAAPGGGNGAGGLKVDGKLSKADVEKVVRAGMLSCAPATRREATTPDLKGKVRSG